MKIFLTYASEDKAAAEPIAFSLRGRGYTVFLDRDDLPPGKSFDQQIERAVNDSDIYIFLISPDSVAETRYTLTELDFARHKWPSPNNRVLPVIVRKTPLEQVPPYLKAVTILEPHGSVAAEISSAVDRMRSRNPWRWVRNPWPPIAAALAAMLLALLFFWIAHPGGSRLPSDGNPTTQADAATKLVTITTSPSSNAGSSTKSEPSDKGITVKFFNGTDETVQLYWIDFDGSEKSYGTIAPQTSITEETYTGHLWTVKTQQGLVLLKYLVKN